jgi:site-specific DNA-methyltransferase (cytosine-N4-specific)
MYKGNAERVLQSRALQAFKKRVQLVFTSPPFPLNHKKRYGNLQGDEYIDWFASFAPLLKQFLAPTGSIVVELGNAWEPGRPVMSTLALRALLAFMERGELRLCQEFICNNPARLPSPAQWVNVERIRLKDSYTRVWWMAATDRPSADNRGVLVEYSPSMKRLLKTQRYNSGRRPSQHHIGKSSFLRNNNGAIPSNVLTFSNTVSSGDAYLDYCRINNYGPHPARMPSGLPEFFIRFLTRQGHIVLDPFAGSNTTGAAAHNLGRKWISIERDPEYIIGSRGRFASLRDTAPKAALVRCCAEFSGP